MTHPDIELLNTVYPAVPAVDLPKSGGGLARFVDADDYLPLSGGTITGDLNVKHPDIEATLADNGISETTWPQNLCGFDKNDIKTSFFGEAVYPNGDIAAGIWAYNYDTSGNQVSSNNISVIAKKDGTKSYNVSNQAAFRAAIGCNPVAYTPTWSQYGTPPHWHCRVSNGICHFMYQGPASATPTNTLLCTFPAACRPSVQTWIPFVKGGGAYGVATVSESDGKLTVNLISSTTNTARLIIDASWPVA